MDQKRGAGRRNSKPTSVVPACVCIVRAMRQGSSSLVCMLATNNFWDGASSRESESKPPLALTLSVTACSTKGSSWEWP